MSIVQFAQNIKNLKQAVSEIKEQSQERITDISKQVEFKQSDHQEFNDLLNQIKQDTVMKLAQFYSSKVFDKTKHFQIDLDSCQADYYDTMKNILEQQELIKQKTENNIEKKQKNDIYILKLIIKAEKLQLIKRTFNSLKSNASWKQKRRHQNNKAYVRFQNTLYRKVFYSWRSSCHKTGYQKMLANQASKDLKNIQQHFIDIIKVLKGKIVETEEQITIKKNAKAEFSYSLSRNLLKTISNLSMEVMSLHQVTIKDNQINKDDNVKFLKEVNQLVQQKLNTVNQIRERLAGDENEKQTVLKETKK